MKIKKLAILILLPLLVLCFLSVGQYSTVKGHTVPVLNDGLIFYMPFDENTSTVAYDLGSQGADGNLMGSTAWVEGVYGSAVSFDGLGDYIDIPSVAIPDGTTDISVSFWFKIDGQIGTRQVIFETSPTYSIDMDSSVTTNYYTLHFLNTTSNDVSISTSAAPVVDTWYYATIVRDEGGTAKLYLNGVVVGTSAAQNGALYNSTGLHIGTYRDANDRWMNGTIDDFRIYNRILNQTEIDYLFEGEPDATPTPVPSSTLGANVTEGDMSNTDWWVSILVVMLIIINIFLMMLPFALVRFTFGILSLFLCMLALSYQIPLSPYLQTAGLLISALAMLFSVRARE